MPGTFLYALSALFGLLGTLVRGEDPYDAVNRIAFGGEFMTISRSTYTNSFQSPEACCESTQRYDGRYTIITNCDGHNLVVGCVRLGKDRYGNDTSIGSGVYQYPCSGGNLCHYHEHSTQKRGVCP